MQDFAKTNEFRGENMSLVVKSKIKEVVKGMRFSGDFANAMDKKVAEMVKEAAVRAKANGRATVRPNDI